MASMVIRNIPDDLMARIKDTARREGKSAEQFAREALADKVRPSREEILRQMDEMRARSKAVNAETFVRIMREARDERDARPYSVDDDRS